MKLRKTIIFGDGIKKILLQLQIRFYFNYFGELLATMEIGINSYYFYLLRWNLVIIALLMDGLTRSQEKSKFGEYR